MAQEIRKVDHYTLQIPDKAGEGSKVLSALRDAGVDFFALWAYPHGAGEASLEMIPKDGAKFAAAAGTAGIKLGKKQTAFYAAGEDRPGAVAAILAPLAQAGISIGAMQAVSAGAGRFGAVVFIPQEKVDQAAKALGAT